PDRMADGLYAGRGARPRRPGVSRELDPTQRHDPDELRRRGNGRGSHRLAERPGTSAESVRAVPHADPGRAGNLRDRPDGPAFIPADAGWSAEARLGDHRGAGIRRVPEA